MMKRLLTELNALGRAAAFAFLALRLLLGGASAMAADAQPPAKVLILHSYHQGAPRTDGLAAGIAKALADGGQGASQMVFYLDAQRLGESPEYPRVLQAMGETLAVAIRAARPKVVIVTDWAALAFWRDRRQSLAPDLPVIYCAVGSMPDWVGAMGHTVGVEEHPAFGPTIEEAMRLRPEAHKLLVLESSAPYFTVIRQQLDKDLPGFAGRLEVYRHANPDMRSIEERLAQLGKDWIVLAVGRPTENGVTLESSVAAKRLSSASPVPVFATWRNWVGHGVVGGRVMSSEEQGMRAGKMAVAILKEGLGGPLPASQEDAGAFRFDYAVLKRFGIDEKLLPPDSLVVNKPFSFYEANKQLVWLYSLITALLFVISGMLALYAAHRRRAQDQMAAQVNFVQSLMEAMPTPVFYKDVNGVYLGSNRAFQEYFGLPSENFIGKTVHDLYPKEEADVFKRQDDALFANGPVQIYEFEKSTPSGPRLIRFHKAVYHDAQGRTAGLVGVIADITDLRAIEQDLERTRNYLQAIIDSSPSAIFGVDADGTVTHANAKARELSGRRPLGLFQEALPGMAQAMELIRLAISEGRVIALPRQLSTKEGKLLAEDVMVYPLHAIGLSEAVVRIDDVTDRHRMEEMLAQSEKMMSVGGLAAGMAHEINNPLGGVMQSAQVIDTRLREDLTANIKAAQEAGVSMQGVRAYLVKREIPALLDGLRGCAKRAAGIVANMLEFSRRSTSAWLPVEVNGLVERAIELCLQDYNLSENFDFKHIAITRRYDRENPSVPCSAQQIQQVVFNLLRNAAQALFEAGTPEPAITVVTRREEQCVVIEVADNGPGMEEAVRRKVFEPFFTTKPPGLGTGLGLSVSYFIVKENHGGEIEVESEPGKGARFLVRLPLKGRRCL